MEIFLIKLLQFILAISLLVLLHEGGHFFFSKLFGVRVEKFYLFFDPSIWKWDGSIFKWKPKKSDTTYGIGWLPLGGYCKISGMIDESFDTEQMQQPVQKWEFRAKPAWQRLLIMIGGVLVNFLLALFIYAMVLYTWGDTYISTKDMTMGMKFNSEAKALGFQDGDMLVGTDKRTFDKFDIDVYRALADADRIDVRRDGKIVGIDMQQHLNLLEMLKTQPAFARPFIPAEIDSVVPGTPAAKAGMQKGDKIMAINGNEIDSWNSFDYEMSRLSDVMTAAENEADSMRTRTVTVAYSKKKQQRGGHRRHDTDTRSQARSEPYKPLNLLQGDPPHIFVHGKPACRSEIRLEHAAWICRRHALSFLVRRSQVARRIRSNRKSLSCTVGLAALLAYDGIPVYHTRFHEHTAYSGARRRPRAVPAL